MKNARPRVARHVPRRAIGVVLGLMLSVTTLVAAGPTARAAAPDLHLTMSGDVASTANSGKVLDAIAAARPDANVFVGDLGYSADEASWCSFVKSHLGALPTLLLAGNHELFADARNGSLADYLACLPQDSFAVTGTYGSEFYVDLPAQNPLVRLVMVSPGLTFDRTTWRYSAGDAHYEWTASTIDDARSRGIGWVVVGAHTPCLSMGRYGCEMGADLANLLVAKRVDLVVNGHEHLYQRTKQLRNHVSGCAAIQPGTYDADCVADDDGSLSRGKGTVFAVVGTAGRRLRSSDLNARDPEAPWFAAKTASQYGFLDLRITPARLEARFVHTGGSVDDSFTITRKAFPVDAFDRPPYAAWGTARPV